MSDLDLILATGGAIPGWIAGRYYGNDTGGPGASYLASAITAAMMYALWCPTPSSGAVIDRIGAEVTTISAGKSFRCGAYRPDGARGRPGTLIVDSGALSAGGTGFVEATVAATLPGNGVWLVILAEDATMQFRGLAAAARMPVGGKPAGGGSTQYGAISVAQAFGALPAAWPGGEAPNTITAIVNVRAA